MALPIARRRSYSLQSLLALGAALTACSGPADDSGGGEGGSTASQGGVSSSSGGATMNGGSSLGGAPTSGGASTGGVPSGGAMTTGGAPTGGAVASGGASTGGAMASGGASTAGGAGTSGTGGTNAVGGTSNGGSGGAGGKTAGGASSLGGATGGGGASNGGGGGTAGKASGGSSGGGNGSGGSGGSGGSTCPYSGHVTYTLAKAANPTQAEQTAYGLITTAMDKAIAYYNCHTNITKSLNVSYVPSVATADGNINGSMRFGSNTTYMDYRTAMHEIGHTVGVGQASNWGSFLSNGLFTGSNASAQLREINLTVASPAYTEVHADTQHFWPYGINQQSEVKSEADLLNHCKMVMAIRKDLGL